MGLLEAAGAVALLAGVACAQSTYATTTGGLLFDIAIPATAAAPFDIVVSITAPTGTGWAGLAVGGGMLRNPLLVAWPNGNSVMVTPRWAASLSLPQPYADASVTIYPTSSVNATHWTANFLCKGCSQWAGGSLNPQGANPLAWALSSRAVPNPASASSTFGYHSAKDHFTFDLTKAALPKTQYDALVATLSGAPAAPPPEPSPEEEPEPEEEPPVESPAPVGEPSTALTPTIATPPILTPTVATPTTLVTSVVAVPPAPASPSVETSVVQLPVPDPPVQTSVLTLPTSVEVPPVPIVSTSVVALPPITTAAPTVPALPVPDVPYTPPVAPAPPVSVPSIIPVPAAPPTPIIITVTLPGPAAPTPGLPIPDQPIPGPPVMNPNPQPPAQQPTILLPPWITGGPPPWVTSGTPPPWVTALPGPPWRRPGKFPGKFPGKRPGLPGRPFKRWEELENEELEE